MIPAQGVAIYSKSLRSSGANVWDTMLINYFVAFKVAAL
jgi:hypothetical protein